MDQTVSFSKYETRILLQGNEGYRTPLRNAPECRETLLFREVPKDIEYRKARDAPT